jgi:N-acetylmuramoyl-L-alanine amidase
LHKKITLILLTTIIMVFLMLSFSFRSELHDIYGYSRAVLSNYGSTGQEVIYIQAKLYNWGYYNGIVDGIYGYDTFNAVKRFQYKNGLVVDGVAGPETLSALGLPAGVASNAGQGGGSSNSNVNLLAHLVHGEARGEPYEGKVAVAAVVLNRTGDSRFPGTIAGVIYQPGAFDAVSDGQFDLEPDTSAYNAARDALNGWDPSYGCIYYYNPSTATSSWIWSRPIIITIGKHNFAQ